MAKPDSTEIWTLLVHPAMTDGLVRFIESRGLYLFPMPYDPDEQHPSYGIGVPIKLLRQQEERDARRPGTD
jgi:hypothetical protein